jgi:diguanylate cyclase (GGDEF)-like protein
MSHLLAPPPAKWQAADRLAHIGASPHLPTPPPIALDVIQKASQPDCELTDIARIIAQDAGLCARVLRTVNSALFGLQHPIESIDRALSYLGLKSVRSLVLSLSLPTLRLPTRGDPRLRDWWTASLAGAIAARELAVRLGRHDAEDDMVSALLSDLGVFVLQQMFPAEFAPVVAASPEVLAERQCELEEEHLGLNHAEVSAFILGRWDLPADITEPIRHHHRPAGLPAGQTAVAQRGRLVYLAVRAAQLQIAPNSQPALLREVLRLACDDFGLSEAKFLDFLQPLNRKIDEFAAILQLDVGSLASYPTVVANATVELIQQRCDVDASAADPELLRWRRIAHGLRREATRDRLTGAFNRAHFDEALLHEYRQARRRGTALGLVLIDLDDLKAVNDRLGHAVGDQMLMEVSATLRRGVRADDVVGRTGGDEFCVLARDMAPEGLPALAGRIRHDLAGLLVRHDAGAAPVVASLGAVVCVPPRSHQTAADFLAAAEEALRAAKADRGQRLHCRSLVAGEDAAFLEELRHRLFSTFLLARDAVTPQQVRAASRVVPWSPLMAGRLARRLGWLTARQLRRVLRDRQKYWRTFEESALALHCLSSEQLLALQALRREPPSGLAGGLVELAALTSERVQAELAAFYQAVAAR